MNSQLILQQLTQYKYKLVPQMREVENQPYQWRPYLMRQASPLYRSDSLNTDELGFRVTIIDGELITYSGFLDLQTTKGIILGNSASFGVGVSQDSRVVSNLLNVNSEKCLWYNFSMRASNMLQERIASELYASEDIKYFIWISGINDLISMILGDGIDIYTPPFIGEPHFLKNMNQVASIKQSQSTTIEDIQQQIERNLHIVSAFRKNIGCKLLFCLQPVFGWTNKKVSAEEQVLITLFDSLPNRIHQAHSNVKQYYTLFSSSLKKSCDKLGIDFIDLNSYFCKEEWLFIDRIHLTDGGHQIISEVILDWFNFQNSKKED